MGNHSGKIKEQNLQVHVKRQYANPYGQKIKNIIWQRIYSTCNVENVSFEDDTIQELNFFFLSTDEQYQDIMQLLKLRFDIDIEVDSL